MREIRHGSEEMRSSMVSVYSQNISNSQVGERCAVELKAYFDDESDLVKTKVSRAFNQMKGDRIQELQGFVSAYIESKAFLCEPESLLDSLEDSLTKLPDLVIRAIERVLESAEKDANSGSNPGSHTEMDVSKLVMRLYDQTESPKLKNRCLDLIDDLERNGYLGIGEELRKIDR